MSRTFGEQVRRLRKARHLTMKELGETLGYSVDYIREVGVDSVAIQAILGHADLSTTQRYTAVVLDVLQDAAAKLEGVLFGQGKGPA